MLWTNYQKQKPQGNLTPTLFLHGPMTWKVMQEMRGKILRTCKENELTITPCMDDHQFEEEIGSIENCLQFAVHFQSEIGNQLFWRSSHCEC